MDAIQSAYGVFESLNLSVTTLILLAFAFVLAFLLSVREAITWFFKIDSLRKELKRMKESVDRLQSDVTIIKEYVRHAHEEALHFSAVAENKKGEQPKSSPHAGSSGFAVIH